MPISANLRHAHNAKSSQSPNALSHGAPACRTARAGHQVAHSDDVYLITVFLVWGFVRGPLDDHLSHVHAKVKRFQPVADADVDTAKMS